MGLPKVPLTFFYSNRLASALTVTCVTGPDLEMALLRNALLTGCGGRYSYLYTPKSLIGGLARLHPITSSPLEILLAPRGPTSLYHWSLWAPHCDLSHTPSRMVKVAERGQIGTISSVCGL